MVRNLNHVNTKTTMKQNFLYICIVFLFAVGCEADLMTPVENEGQDFQIVLKRKSSENVPVQYHNGDALDTSYFVTEGDIADMVRYRYSETKSSSDTYLISYEAIPYGFEDDQTLLYIVNYPTGNWEIISADKRAPMVFASGEGSFEPDTTGLGPMFYVDLLADQVLQLRQNDMLCSEGEANRVLRRSEIGDDELQLLDVIGPFPINYLYLIGTETEETVVEQVNPLLYTKWGQRLNNDDIYNRYCPLKSNSSTLRAPAGCVPVAGAQVLHCLYKRSGVSVHMPDWASCGGNVNNYTQEFATSHNVDYIRDIPVRSSEATSQNKNYLSIFLAWIGNQVGVTYGDDASSAYTSDLVEVFDMYDVNCTYLNSFDANLAINNIKSRVPVIIKGRRTVGSTTTGHAWMADGYRRTDARTTYYYYTSPLELSPWQIASLTIEDSNYSRSTTTVNKYFHMNWGWDGDYDSYYLVSSDSWSPKETPYNIDIGMIYGFTKL